MRFKSRFTVIGILALLAIMVITIVPASAGTLTSGVLTLAVVQNDGTALPAPTALSPITTKVGNTLWVSNKSSAFNRVTIVLALTTGQGPQTAEVANSTLGGTKPTINLPETPATGTLTIVAQPSTTVVAATGIITITNFSLLAGDTVTITPTGGAVALVEPTDWDDGTSNNAVAISLAAAINAAAGLADVSAAAVGAVVTVTATTGGTAGNSITMAYTPGTGSGITLDSALSGGVDADTMTIFGKTYTFEANGALTDVNGNIEVGTDLAGTHTNIVNALSLGGTPGTGYALSMTSGAVSAATFGADGATNVAPLTHKAGGTAGNAGATLAEGFADAGNIFNGTALSGGAADGNYRGHFFVGTATAAETGLNTGVIGGSDLNILRVAAGGDVVSLKVDSKGPTISVLSPDDGLVTRADTVDFTGTISDSGSGIIDDSVAPDNDGDGVTREPVTEDGTGGSILGASTFINIQIDNTNPTTIVAGNENSDRALWTEVTAGQEYSFTFAKVMTEADHEWFVKAQDRVGNTDQSDSSSDSGDQNNDFTVDKTEAGMGDAITGIGWDGAKKEEKRDSKSIKVIFTRDGVSGGAADDMDPDEIQTADFLVEGSTVTGVTFPNLKASKGKVFVAGVLTGVSTKNLVYISLADKLPPDETPIVRLVGTVKDLAGNSSAIGEKKAADGIVPGFTIKVTGSASSRPVAVGDSDDKIEIRVTADEDLSTPPTIYLVGFEWDDAGNLNNGDGKSDRLEVGNAISILEIPLSLSDAVSGLTNTWEVDRTAGAFTNSLVGVHVTGLDESGNRGSNKGITTTGTNGTPVVGDKVDLSKMSDALFEFDDRLSFKATDGPSGDAEAVDFALTPASGTNKTESATPFIRIDFNEGKEYPIFNDDTGTIKTDKPGFGTPEVKVEIDSHNAVTLTKLELEDEDGNTTDLLGTEGNVDKDSFVVVLQDLAVGTYTLSVNAVDAVGNDFSDDREYAFEVEERGEYEITLDPGWNLISLPGTPADPSIDSVLPDSMKVSRVLQWVRGAFEVAERNSDGTWDPSGGVTELVAGPGYWVFTTAFEDIKTLIPERNPATVLPTVDIVGGWNLVGIVDQAQAEQGDPPGGVETFPRVYFSSIEWSVAYSYDTTTGLWTKYISATSTNVENGKGYWVWASKAGTLVP